MTSTTASQQQSSPVPSVLVALVVRDAEPWLRESLAALAALTYPRLGVIAIDNASTDGSHDILLQALGDRRVMRFPEDRGLAGSLKAVLEISAAREADYLLILHDDAAMDPDGVTRLVEAAISIPGVDNVGVVGAKVVDWEDPRLLRDVGSSADRFGHRYTPLQPGEIDQGQFDRVLEVLGVDPCALLVSRDAWQRVGLFDERLDVSHEGLDLCWRVRMAGFRVLMTPSARVRHRQTSVGERRRDRDRRSDRYYEDRAALASMLKNYGLLSLLWLLPLTLLLGLTRLAVLALSRRFDEAYDLVSAWGWNVLHLPGTLRRRFRAQRARTVPDRKLHRFMESAGLRLPRWFEKAERIFEEQRSIEEADEGQPATRRLRDRTASLVGDHPVLVGSFVAIVVGGLSIRGLMNGAALHGGVLPVFPSSSSGFFHELAAPYRSTALGGSLPASPALAGAGVLSWALFGSTSLAQKVLLAGVPALAGILFYRAAVRLTGRAGAAVLGAACYVLSAALLWPFSQGRIGLLVAAALIPALAERTEIAFGSEEPADGRWRFMAGLGVTLAVGVAAEPGVLLAFAVLVVVQVIAGGSRRRGMALVVGGTLAAAALVFPFVPSIIAGGGRAIGSLVGTVDLSRVGRLALGPGPGTWLIAGFLPISAALGFSLVRSGDRARALRMAVVAAASLLLAWLSAAGWLPSALANAPVYIVLAAAAEALLVSLGLASVLGMARESFGARQIGTAALAVVLAGGLSLQALSAMAAGWAWGGAAKIPAAWAVVDSGVQGDFNVLWVGAGTDPFPAPGGDPRAVAAAGDATIRYAITGRSGAPVIDIGRPLAGPGADALQASIEQILAGGTSHGGALLAPFAVRFVVAAPDSLPASTIARLGEQVDMDPATANGLVIYRNAVALPPAAALGLDDAGKKLLAGSDPSSIERLGPVPSTAFTAVPGGWDGAPSTKDVPFIATEFSDGWTTGGAPPVRAFGWATAFPGSRASGTIEIRHTDDFVRLLELWVLGALWLVALWITRKPVVR
jgi:GT2 family glycosyltransferase